VRGAVEPQGDGADGQRHPHRRRRGAAFPELTAREHGILDLLAAGLNNSVLAGRIGVAPKTVANNVSSIFTKLRVADRAQTIVRARDAPGPGLSHSRYGTAPTVRV